MKIKVERDSTHVIVTFRATSPEEGYEFGKAFEQIKSYGVGLADVAPMIQICYPIPPPERSI